MNTILSVYKPVGATPLEMIQLVRKRFPEYKDVPIGYAGRLDPLARGVLLLMIGDATKDRDMYLGLPKTYIFEVLYGVTTDSYDYLGLLSNTTYNKPNANVNILVKSFVNSRTGSYEQSYPPFSSKTVHGKPLFQWAKEKRLHEIAMPKQTVTIETFDQGKNTMLAKNELYQRIVSNIKLVKGDFRQVEILQKWEEFFALSAETTFMTSSFTITCSSGTYIRGIIHELGKTIGCGAIALDIYRTKVGEYTIEDSLRL